MNKTVVDIKGMHCRSCELLVEDKFKEYSQVKNVVVDQSKGTAEIEYEGTLTQEEIARAVNCAGYCLGKDEKPYFSKNPRDYRDLAIAGFILLDLFLVAKALGLFNISLTNTHNYSSLPVVFLIGLTAGISTCMALVGGLVLGAASRFAEKHPTATTLQKFKPHLFFNLGRIISYTVLGGAIGFLGSFFQISTSVLGTIIIAVGIVMLLLGAQLVEIFPFLKGVTFTLPKGISRLFGISDRSEKEYSHTNSMVMGATTFFLPCGFTQAMQLFAISSGSALVGALTLGTFALGTAPGLLGVGGITSLVKGTAARLFFKTAGIVVIILALFNISNGYNLVGVDFVGEVAAVFGPPKVAVGVGATANIQNGVQIINMDQTSNGYTPNNFNIKVGVPVRWIINSKDPHSCAASIVSPKLNISKVLNPGENVIEFTPTEVGTIKFTCSMGMFQGVFNVVAAGGNTAAIAPAVVQQAAAAPKAGGSCGSGGGGCGCGGGKANAQPTVQAPAAVQEGATQVIKTVFTYSKDISPNSFTVKSGKPVRFEVDAKENGSGCMGSITLPGLTDKIDLLTAGKTSVFEFTPTKAGKYQITCAMGVPRGVINVL